MDRRRAAGALLALAACFACSAAAPTTGDHAGLDLYDGGKEGCYYNFQHYGEGDRIMTNEPCLNCTCHNRMLMCYLRVCPFTKAIGQDCTVEKRADQCCPIVTCPDVPVDLLTSTSTSSPAEYGGTGVGKLDNYGCSINGKYFPEGAKVPPMPNRPCEHCYCIRNMTTCVMQECTLHVDGCTPIYHKDVCCPVRYFCDHPEDEMPLLDDMTTTVRPTPGFLLTTTTETPTTLTQARRECIEDDQLYPDGALIKTEKPCVHCYCMKGDIVCVVQECGTPMENEGKNCSSLPPREGQCCPDTYICEGDELTTNIATETPFEELTTVLPTRRVSVEGSGYRNEPDELPYTETPTFVSEIEGSGEEQLTISPLETSEILIPEKQTTASDIDSKYDTTDQGIQYSPITTQVSMPEEVVTPTTEPDKGQNTVPSDIYEEESSEPPVMEKTTEETGPKVTIPDITLTSGFQEKYSSEPEILATTTKDESKVTEHTQISEQSTAATVILEEETSELSLMERTTLRDETKVSEITNIPEQVTISSDVDERATEPSKLDETTTVDDVKPTEQNIISGLNTIPIKVSEEQSSGPSAVETTTHREEAVTISSIVTEKDFVPDVVTESRRTSSRDEVEVTEPTTASEKEESSESSILERTTHKEKIETTEPAIISGLNTIPSKIEEEESSKPSVEEITTINPSEETKVTEIIATDRETDASRIGDKDSMVTKMTEPTILTGDKETQEPSTTSSEYLTTSHADSSTYKEEQYIVTTEPPFRKEDEGSTLTETFISKEDEKLTTAAFDLMTVSAVTSEYVESSSLDTNIPSIEHEVRRTSTQSPEKDIEETMQPKEPTTESLLDTTIHVTKLDKESVTTLKIEMEIDTTTTSERLDLPETTTINPVDNEISEDISPILTPGRIPGEGDCLFNGKTYRNDSVVPNTNKCHASCRCVSSIVKCDPIICSPQPEYMDNCQLTYDTPDSCCPTYVCDHSKETIPPESHSQMSGTESPLPSPSIECQGDECQVTVQTQPPTISSEMCASGACTDKLDEKPPITSCESDDCDETVQKPIYPEGCTNDKCTQPPESCTDSNCQVQPTKDLPEDTSDNRVPKPCESPDECKDVTIPDISQASCEGESCTSIKDQPCDKDSGCETSIDKTCSGENCVGKPEMAGTRDGPQICENQDDCTEMKIPETAAASHCDGESCIKEDCSSGKCVTDATLPPQAVPDKDVCKDENGCRKTSEETPIECAEEDCRRIQTSDTENKLPSDCKDSECVQPKPDSPTQEVTITVPLSTDSPITEKTELETVTLLDQGMTSPQSLVTYFTLPLETITSVTDKIEKDDEHPEEHETKLQETATEQLESASESPALGSTDNEQIMLESPTQGPEIASELPETMVTKAKSQEGSTMPSEEKVTDTEMHATSELPSTAITSSEITKTKPSDEEDIHTEIVQVTEPQEKYTSQPEEVVTEQQETTEALPEMPVSHIKDYEESTSRKPEASDQTETVTHIPDISATESEKATREPEPTKYEILGTKLPLEETKYASTTEPGVVATEDFSTKVQETATRVPEGEKTTLEPEIKTTEPVVFETPKKDIDTSVIPEVTDVSITEEQELSSKEPMLSVTESYDLETKVPQGVTSIEEAQTEISGVDITRLQEPLTNAPYGFDKQTTIGITESSRTEYDIKITTQAIDVTEIEEVKTEPPESSQTKDKESSTESFVTSDEYYSKTTDYVPTAQDELLKPHITQALDIPTPQEMITSPSPSKGPEEYVTTTIGISVTEEEKVQTELPLSLVTKIQQTDATTSLLSISEPTEIKTEQPSEVPESTVSGNLPEYHVTKIPEIQEEPAAEPGIIAPEHAYEEVKTEPDVAYTDRPYSSVTDLEKSTDVSVPQGETETDVSAKVTSEESPVTKIQEISTESSVPSVTEYVTSSITVSEEMKTEKPSVTEIEEHAVTEKIGYDTEPSAPSITESPYEPIPKETSMPSVTEIEKESESTEKVAGAHVSPTTEIYEIATQKPAAPGGEFYTALPEYTEQESTEKQELETKTPEESHSKLPEYTAEPAITQSEEKTTEKSKPEFESEEKTTEITKPSVEENVQTDIPISTESPTTPKISQEPELVEHEEKTTEAQEEIISEQALDTQEPELVTTKEQESHTEPSVSYTTTSQKEITKIQESSTTEQDNLRTGIPESTEAESGRHTTEIPKVTLSEQEYGTVSPKIEEPQEFEIKTLEPSELTTKSTVEEIKTELAEHVTKQEPSITEFATEQNEVMTMPTLHEIDHEGTPAVTLVSVVGEPEETGTKEPELVTIETQELDSKKPESTDSTPIESPEIPVSPVEVSAPQPTESIIKTPEQTTEHEYSETTPYLVELEEHTHKIEVEVSTILPSEETITERTEAYESEYEPHTPEVSTEKDMKEDKQTETLEQKTEIPFDEKEGISTPSQETSTPTTLTQTEDKSEKTTEPSFEETTAQSLKPLDTQELDNKYGTESQKDQEILTSTPKQATEEEPIPETVTETEKPSLLDQEIKVQTEKDLSSSTIKPFESDLSFETTAPEEEFIPATTKVTTAQTEEEASTQTPTIHDKFTKPEEKPEMVPPTPVPETPRPGLNDLQPTDEVPSPEEEGHFPPSGGYGQEPDYVEEDQAFGPGTCRYGGKVYVSAQQIPRDDPCDFCFCFRSDIICLQQSCPPPIHGCHEEPIQGFCCPRYECPVSMATTLNVTTTTTTTTTTLPPHFLPHAYKGAAQRRGCQIKGHTYKVGEVVRASSGPCLHCTCGGDGQMKCDPKACTPEPMLRQMIAAAVSAKRRR